MPGVQITDYLKSRNFLKINDNGSLDVNVLNGGTGGTTTSEKENPFNTQYGQDVVSVSESYWARMAREGRWRRSHVLQLSASTGSLQRYGVLIPSIGTRLFPKSAIISCDKDAILQIRINTGVVDGEMIYHMASVKANMPLQVDFEGEIFLLSSGEISLNVQPLNEAGNVTGSIVGIEVADNG